MKKLLFIAVILMGANSLQAEDLVKKRLNIASQAVQAATQLADALETLRYLKEQRAKLPIDFQDSDFVGSDLNHLTASRLGTLFDFVVPSFDDTYEDVGNGGRNKQILLQVRK